MAPELIIIDDQQTSDETTPTEAPTSSSVKAVRVEIFAMSKCPFFQRAFFEIIPVVEKLGKFVDFQVHYVGNLTESGEITSMHGQEEIDGDMQQLCARKLGNTRQWLDFMKCQTEDARAIPENWAECAKNSGIDASKLQACYKSELGKKLLAESIAYSLEKNVNASPQINLNGVEHLKPRREISFGRAVCADLKSANITACSDYPPAQKISATLITDKRCDEKDCEADYLDLFLNSTLDSVETVTLDYSNPKGAQLFKKSGFRFIPVVIFSPSIKEDEYAYGKLRDYLTEMDSGDLAYPVGRFFDPTLEICDDGIDNTGNGKADCDDPFCAGHWLCREEKKNRVELYIMSHCPYCTLALKAMNEVLAKVDYNRDTIDFRVGFVGEASADELYSAHGIEEVIEDLRQICVQKYYPDNYKFMEYFLCRNRAFMGNRDGEESSTDWKACAGNGINATLVQKCATGPEGKKLLLDAFRRTRELEIGGAPTWMLNNKYEMDARTPKDIVEEFCSRNADNPLCD